jgi:hypothetical protein
MSELVVEHERKLEEKVVEKLLRRGQIIALLLVCADLSVVGTCDGDGSTGKISLIDRSR